MGKSIIKKNKQCGIIEIAKINFSFDGTGKK